MIHPTPTENCDSKQLSIANSLSEISSIECIIEYAKIYLSLLSLSPCGKYVLFRTPHVLFLRILSFESVNAVKPFIPGQDDFSLSV